MTKTTDRYAEAEWSHEGPTVGQWARAQALKAMAAQGMDVAHPDAGTVRLMHVLASVIVTGQLPDPMQADGQWPPERKPCSVCGEPVVPSAKSGKAPRHLDPATEMQCSGSYEPVRS